LNNEILVIIAVALTITLAVGLATTGTLQGQNHLAFAKKNSKVFAKITNNNNPFIKVNQDINQ
jgi:hypothetical protein